MDWLNIDQLTNKSTKKNNQFKESNWIQLQIHPIQLRWLKVAGKAYIPLKSSFWKNYFALIFEMTHSTH